MKKLILYFFILIILSLTSCSKDKDIVITYETNGGSPLNNQVILGDSRYIEIIPEREGYRFIGWFTDPNFDNKSIVSVNHIFLKDTTLYAKWEMRTYVVKISFYNELYYEKLYYIKYNDVLFLDELTIDGKTYSYFYYNYELLEPYILVKDDMYITASEIEVDYSDIR